MRQDINKHEKLFHFSNDVDPYVEEDFQCNNSFSLNKKKTYSINPLSVENIDIPKDVTQQSVKEKYINEDIMLNGFEGSCQNNTEGHINLN
jgi:hypothetical protein